jgi:hypothetical protein
VFALSDFLSSTSKVQRVHAVKTKFQYESDASAEVLAVENIATQMGYIKFCLLDFNGY